MPDTCRTRAGHVPDTVWIHRPEAEERASDTSLTRHHCHVITGQKQKSEMASRRGGDDTRPGALAPEDWVRMAELVNGAERPVIYAGQANHIQTSTVAPSVRLVTKRRPHPVTP